MKKQIFLALIFALLFSPLMRIQGQAASNCVNAITLNSSTNNTNYIQSDSIGWFQFAAQSNSVGIKLNNIPDAANQGHIHKIGIYTGTCSSLTFVGESSVPPFSDSVIYFGSTNFVSGNTYFIKTIKEPNSCVKCIPNARFKFEIITNPSSGCNWTIPSVINVPTGGSLNSYPGIAGVFANAGYFMRVTQVSGTLQLSNFYVGWLDCNGVSYAATTNYNGIDGAPACLSGWTSFSIDGNVVGNPSPGEQLCLHFEIFDFLGQLVCDNNICIVVCGTGAGDDQTICIGNCTTLSALGASSFDWYDQNTLVGSGASVSVCPTTTTTYTALPTTGICNPDPAQVTVNVIVPKLSFSFVNELCVGETFTFTNTTQFSNSNADWDFGDGTSTLNSFDTTHIYTQPGQYEVTLTGYSQGCSSTITQLISVTPAFENYCSNQLVYTYNGSVHLNNQNDVTNFLNSFAINSLGFNAVGIKDTLFIESGVNVTIANSNLDFGTWGKIIVKQSAKLIVDNCNLQPIGLDQEHQCAFMWQGVEVWGDNSKTQTQLIPNTQTLYQGYFEMKNGSFIHKAHNGIIAGKWNRPSFDANTGGGIVLVGSNCGILNCGYGIRFTPYSKVSISKILTTNFFSNVLDDPGYITGNSYTYPNAYNQIYGYANPTGRTYCYIQVIGVKFVKIQGNTLNNAENGIIGINSTLTVGGVNITEQNIFTNLSSGEIHGNIFNSSFFANKITNNQYTNTLIPIQSWNGVGDNIRNNSIPNGAFIGIGTVGTKSIFITDNTVAGCFLGVSTSNTGTSGGLIGYDGFGNQFNNCVTGVYTAGTNPNLQIHCNTHFNQQQQTNNWNISGSLANQGFFPAFTDKDPAGNLFTSTLNNSNLYNKIYSATSFQYFGHQLDQQTNTFEAVLPTPSGTAGNVLTAGSIISQPFTKIATSCDPGPPLNNYSLRISQLTTKVNSLTIEKDSIKQILDRGNTQTLLNAINSNMSSGQLQNLLLQNSPLSDEVLLAYIAKVGTPPGNFGNVILLNSPVSENVNPALLAKIATFPNGINNQILAAQSNYSNRTLYVVSTELLSVQSQRQDAYNKQQAIYVSKLETDSTVLDSMNLLLLQQNNQSAIELLAAGYIDSKQYTNAQNAINLLTGTSVESVAYKTMLQSMLTVYSSGRDVFSLTSAEQTSIRSIAQMQSDCPARANARLILFVAFGEPLVMDIPQNGQRISPEIEGSTIQMSQSETFIGEPYPNPSNEGTTIEAKISDGHTGIIRIFDMNGKIVYQQTLTGGYQLVQLNTKDWTDGIYLCELSDDGNRIGNQKFVIQH
jgi:Secretion system C-terminal sorting domain/PKD domain